MLTITCFLWAYQLVAGDGTILYSPLYRTPTACQDDADAKAAYLGVPSMPCFYYQVCFPVTPEADAK